MGPYLMPMPSSPPETTADQYCSRPVDSKQEDIHPRLRSLVEKHSHSMYRRPVRGAARRRFDEVERIQQQSGRRLVLDSGCGTGLSTRLLARQHPSALVIGVDKSEHRLARGKIATGLESEDNCLFVRMDLVDFWLLAKEHRWQLQYHYLLYPNPWPKPRHLQRRWYAHPILPSFLALGGQLEIRCNWLVYAREFQFALGWATKLDCSMESFLPDSYISLFETKYARSGLELYRCRIQLDPLVSSNH